MSMGENVCRLALWGGLLGSLGGLLGGCSLSTSTESDVGSAPNSGVNSGANSESIALKQVVATTPLLCNLVEEITGEVTGERAGSSIALTCLMSPGQDPHSYRLKPSDRTAIESADLILDHGYDLMPAVTEVLQAASSSPTATIEVVAVAEQAVPDPLLFEEHAHAEHEDEEHAEHADEEHSEHEGEEHAELVPDPHVWHDPRNGQAIVTTIAEQLSTLDPENATDYSANATDLSDRLGTLHVWIGDQVATIPEGDRQLVTTHDAFGYLAAAYDLTQSSALSGLNPNEKPSPAQLATIVEQVKTSGAPALFAENTLATTLIEAVAKDAGIPVAELPLLVNSPDPMIEDAANYPAMLAHNTCIIVEALGGECDRASLGF